jgi:hypothetical protein
MKSEEIGTEEQTGRGNCEREDEGVSNTRRASMPLDHPPACGCDREPDDLTHVMHKCRRKYLLLRISVNTPRIRT